MTVKVIAAGAPNLGLGGCVVHCGEMMDSLDTARDNRAVDDTNNFSKPKPSRVSSRLDGCCYSVIVSQCHSVIVS